MRIVVRGETELEVSSRAEGLEIREEGGGHFGPMEMLAASLGTCTVAVLATWAANLELEAAELAVAVRWEYAEEPYRVGAYELEVRWPSLSPEREVRARRVAEACTVHRTLEHAPEMTLGFSR